MLLERSGRLSVNKRYRNLPESTLVNVEKFSFDYEAKKESPLLNQLSFSIGRSETVLLMGPSGSGKSTLALCLNGLFPEVVEGWSEGNIYYEGKRLDSFEKGAVNQRVGVVFQDPESQFCMITVENELAFTMENINVPREKMEERMEHVLVAVGLEEERYRAIHELSGGQKQKVALASVLLLQPSLLILDEPTANLDPASRKEFIDLIDSLKQSREIAVLIIEHQLDDWVAQTDRVLAMDKAGRLFVEGAPQDVFYRQYSDLQREGIHLPKVVRDTVETGIYQEFNPDEMPLTEKELAIYLYNNKLNTLEKSADPISDHGLSTSSLTFSGVGFARQKKPILSGVNVSLNTGEFVGIVGENGAGKSTLLQLMAGILSPGTGARTFLGKPFEIWEERDLRRDLGFVFQNPEHQFITDTVYDELAFGMKLNGTKSIQVEENVKALLASFQLEGKEWTNPFALSGGQKRRLSVATMLDENPKLLLFDEPTFGQDAKTTEELMRMISKLRDQGTTIVFVTHDMELVDQYCEKVYVLQQGSVSFGGSPRDLWEETSLIESAHLRLPYRVRVNQEVKRLESETNRKQRREAHHAHVH